MSASPRDPEAKGLVERFHDYLERSWLPGRSFADILRGRTVNWTSRAFFEYSYVRGLRTENMKLIQRSRQWPSELYDLEADPGETENVIGDGSYAKVLASMRGDLDRFFQERSAPSIEDWRSTTKQILPVYPPHKSGK